MRVKVDWPAGVQEQVEIVLTPEDLYKACRFMLQTDVMIPGPDYGQTGEQETRRIRVRVEPS